MWPTSFSQGDLHLQRSEGRAVRLPGLCCLQSIGVVQIYMFFEIVFQAKEAVKIVLVFEDVMRSRTKFLGSMDGIRHSLPKALDIAALLQFHQKVLISS